MSSDNQDYDAKAVDDILSTALERSVAEPTKPSSYLPLAYNDTKLLEVLADDLSTYLNAADVQVVLDGLRDKLYVGIGDSSLKTLHSVTLNCKRCPSLNQPAKLPHWNLKDPDVVFITESSYMSETDMDYFIDSVQAAGFHSRNICMTFLNRCSAAGHKITDEETNNCFGYLSHEIQILKPKLILGLGLKVMNTICGSQMKLGDERGKVIWIGPWAYMGTWTPGYALASGGAAADQFKNDIRTAFQFVYGRLE